MSSVRRNLANTWTQPTRGRFQRIVSIEEDHLDHLLESDGLAQSPLQECSEAVEASDNEEDIDLVMSDIYPSAKQPKGAVAKIQTPTSLRGQPVGKETSMNVSM